jgi:uncharacterized protein
LATPYIDDLKLFAAVVDAGGFRPPAQHLGLPVLAFSASAPIDKLPLPRAVYAATLAHIVTLSQTLHEELKSQGVRVQALCPGIVATEFHERQGFDLSAVPRMSAEDVVTASLRGLALGEVLCAPGVEKSELLDALFEASLAAFHAQAPTLAQRYRIASISKME